MMNKVSDLCPTCPMQPYRFQADLNLFRWRSHFLSNPHDLKRFVKRKVVWQRLEAGYISTVSVSVFLSTVFLCSPIDRPAPDLSTHTKSAAEIWHKSSGRLYKPMCMRIQKGHTYTHVMSEFHGLWKHRNNQYAASVIEIGEQRWCWWWSLLYRAILNPRADSLRFCRMSF